MCWALDAGPPSDALIHQDFEKQKSLTPLLRWPLPLIALSITPGGWSIRALPLCSLPPSRSSHPHHLSLLLLYCTLYFSDDLLSAAWVYARKLNLLALSETRSKARVTDKFSLMWKFNLITAFFGGNSLTSYYHEHSSSNFALQLSIMSTTERCKEMWQQTDLASKTPRIKWIQYHRRYWFVDLALQPLV